ncbi:MAG TPA: YybS family protein [Virgibacillus sp.]|nr:YybS family protein [Virgibacillus sp.]
MNQTREVTDGAMWSAIYIVLLLITIFIPFFMLVGLFILPIPFIIYASKYDWRPSLIMFGAIIILSLFFATAFTLPMTILSGIGGIMIGSAIHHRSSAYETWVRGSMGFIVGLLFVFLFTQLLLQIDFAAQMDSVLDESMELSEQLLEKYGFNGTGEEGIALIEESLSQVKNLIPVGIAIAGIIIAFLSQWAAYKVMNRLQSKEMHFPPFRMLNFPVAIVWVYFILLVTSFMELDPDGLLSITVSNFSLLVGFFLTLQGLSFIFFYWHHRKWSKVLPIISVVATILFPFLLIYFIRIIGIIDIGFGLRSRIVNGDKEK